MGVGSGEFKYQSVADSHGLCIMLMMKLPILACTETPEA